MQSYDLTANDIKSEFEYYGPVKKVRVLIGVGHAKGEMIKTTSSIVHSDGPLLAPWRYTAYDPPKTYTHLHSYTFPSFPPRVNILCCGSQVTLVTDRKGKSRGYAFVEFESSSDLKGNEHTRAIYSRPKSDLPLQTLTKTLTVAK